MARTEGCPEAKLASLAEHRTDHAHRPRVGAAGERLGQAHRPHDVVLATVVVHCGDRRRGVAQGLHRVEHPVPHRPRFEHRQVAAEVGYPAPQLGTPLGVERAGHLAGQLGEHLVGQHAGTGGYGTQHPETEHECGGVDVPPGDRQGRQVRHDHCGVEGDPQPPRKACAALEDDQGQKDQVELGATATTERHPGRDGAAVGQCPADEQRRAARAVDAPTETDGDEPGEEGRADQQRADRCVVHPCVTGKDQVDCHHRQHGDGLDDTGGDGRTAHSPHPVAQSARQLAGCVLPPVAAVGDQRHPSGCYWSVEVDAAPIRSRGYRRDGARTRGPRRWPGPGRWHRQGGRRRTRCRAASRRR
jgi:hypothetical protein